MKNISERLEIGRERVFLDFVDSTNTYALTLAEKGYPHGTVVVANMQITGRGRLGRRWHSPPDKNIYMSIILRKPKGLSLLTLMAAVAATEAIGFWTPLPIMVKWPNDIMAQSREDREFKKLGGILSETRFSGNKPDYTVVGIGINVNSQREDFPPDIIHSATSLRIATGRSIDRHRLIEDLIGSFERWYKILQKGHKEDILDAWKDISLTTGKEVAITTEGRVIKGVAVDIDGDGRLLLRLPSGIIKRIDSGDVVHIR